MTQPTPKRAPMTMELFAKAVIAAFGPKVVEPPARPLRPRVVDLRGVPRRRAV